MATTDELHDFVRDALSRGTERAEIEQVLIASGWSGKQAHAALAGFAEVSFSIPVPRPRTHVDARDAFLYLVLFSTLYICTYHLGSLIFEFINQWFPDPAFSNQDYRTYAASALRWSIASLIVAV